jgi:hypothetical protein
LNWPLWLLVWTEIDSCVQIHPLNWPLWLLVWTEILTPKSNSGRGTQTRDPTFDVGAPPSFVGLFFGSTPTTTPIFRPTKSFW